jgi:hypothetical protein
MEKYKSIDAHGRGEKGAKRIITPRNVFFFAKNLLRKKKTLSVPLSRPYLSDFRPTWI